MTPAAEIRPALQGSAGDVVGWALRALAISYDLTEDEVAVVAEAFVEIATAQTLAQLADAAGEPAARRCLGCGCSDARSCPGGCIWATATLCSRCAA